MWAGGAARQGKGGAKALQCLLSLHCIRVFRVLKKVRLHLAKLRIFSIESVG